MDRLGAYVQALGRICEKRSRGKKAIQKLMYLMERKGVNFELDYTIHFFGPYSAKLDGIFHRLESDEVVNIDTSGRTHLINILDTSMCKGGALSQEENKIVDYIINEFGDKPAFELEGIATLDYVACNLPSEKQNDVDILNEVKRIKGSKFTYQQLKEYLALLKQQQYLP